MSLSKVKLPALDNQGGDHCPAPRVHPTALFESAATLRKDCNGIVEEWSDGAEKLFGYTATEMVGRSILCLFPPDRVNEEFALMQMIREGQDLSYLESTRIHKNGTSMHVALNLTGIWDIDKNLIGIRSAVRRVDLDVYNAQHVHDLLAQTQYLQCLVDQADAAIYSLDARGKVHSWSAGAETLFGYKAIDIVGRSVKCLLPVEEQQKWQNVILNMQSAKTVHSMEAIRLHKNGTPINVSITLIPIINKAQELIGVNVTVRSIEEKIRARITELSLKRQSKYFEAIVNSSDDAIFSHDVHGVIQSWNASSERLFGYSSKEMMGESITKILSLEKQCEHKRLVDNLLRGIPVNHLNTAIQCKNGSELPVSISMSKLTDDDTAVVGISIIGRDISERIVAEKTIWQHANFDSLTGLPNPRLLVDRANQLLPECTRRKEKAALVYIDLDHLKEINDELGYAVGDAVLVEMAKRLSVSIRAQDTAARLGGDDFIVLINGFTESETIDNVVERIQRALEEPLNVGSREINITFSAGVSLYPDDAVNWADLLGHADSALTSAKKAGRHRVRYFTQDLKDKTSRRRFILSAFQHALEKDELRMHYQPVVDMATGCIVKAEALIRWTHSSGPIAPMEFIPLIEQSDLIHKFGDFVMQQVASDAQLLRKQFSNSFGVTFNVSPAQLKSSNSLVDHWRTLIGPNSFEDAGLIAEITEGMMVDSDTITQHNLLSLHSAGIGVAIDDFGTGYSSLHYLTKINAQVIKIDRSFTNNLIVNPKTDALCEAIIVMAQKMGMRVVAEGVETQAQWDKLLEMGCDMAQGYFIAKPMPLDTLLFNWTNPCVQRLLPGPLPANVPTLTS